MRGRPAAAPYFLVSSWFYLIYFSVTFHLVVGRLKTNSVPSRWIVEKKFHEKIILFPFPFKCWFWRRFHFDSIKIYNIPLFFIFFRGYKDWGNWVDFNGDKKTKISTFFSYKNVTEANANGSVAVGAANRIIRVALFFLLVRLFFLLFSASVDLWKLDRWSRRW